MYNNAVDLAKGTKSSAEVVFNLATVTSVDSDGRASVKFYGDSNASGKLYPYIYGYKPTVNDDVLMIKQGSTYIIAGKISKSAVGDDYYVTKAALDAASYLTQAVADTLYMPLSTTFDKLTQGSNTLTLNSNKALVPNGNGTFDIGSSSYKFDEAYINTIYASKLKGDWHRDPSVSNKEYLTWSSDTAITPKTNETVSLGSSSRKLKEVYSKDGIFTNIFGDWKQDSTYNYALKWTSGTTNRSVYPSSTNAINLGSSSYQYNNVYAKQFYQNGTAISTSDKRKKKTIKDIAKKYIDFFKKLRPVSFKFKDGESDRTHTGFIAQECEEAAGEAGIDNKDLAFLCIDEDGNYGLRYEELIAIQTKVIQDLITRVEALENKITEGSMS